MTLSIRARLVLWVFGGMAVLLSVFAFVVYEFLNRSLITGFDAVLEASAKTIAGSVEQTDATVKAEIDERDMPEFRRADRPNYYQLWTSDRTVLARSTSLKGADLDPAEVSATPSFRRVLLPDGRLGRAVGMLFEPKIDDESKTIPQPQTVMLVVARDTAELDGHIRFVRLLIGFATGGTVILGLILGAVIVRQGLRPLDALAVRIAAIRQDDLSTRLPFGSIPAEVVPVVDKLNDLLCRLEDAFSRERAFTADAAHELRTPLAGMRSTLEVALARPRSGSDYRDAISDSLQIICRMQAMIENLLALARIERGQTAFHLQAIDLQELITAAWCPLTDRVRARGITEERQIPAGLSVTADRDTVMMVLTNLLENAAEYTNDKGRITIEAMLGGGRVSLKIENSGCRLSEAEAHQVFDRFWRGDSSRSATGLHCGLGLALVQRAVLSLSGTVTAEARDGIFSVHVTLPASPSCCAPPTRG
jgi:signal transduction histidine kinase